MVAKQGSKPDNQTARIIFILKHDCITQLSKIIPGKRRALTEYFY